MTLKEKGWLRSQSIGAEGRFHLSCFLVLIRNNAVPFTIGRTIKLQQSEDTHLCCDIT